MSHRTCLQTTDAVGKLTYRPRITQGKAKLTTYERERRKLSGFGRLVNTPANADDPESIASRASSLRLAYMRGMVGCSLVLGKRGDRRSS